MQTDYETSLCRYQYDALNRLVDCIPIAKTTTQRFYLKDRLATEIQGTVQRSIMRHEDQLLAQQQRQSGTVETQLLATDQQRSVLNVLDATRLHPLAYSPYGHCPAQNSLLSLLSLLGFNGERPDPVTGHYLLGNGYRAFNPVLMRFNSPDSWSPFGKGGLNAYAYCVGDPVNAVDPTGHSNLLMSLLKGTGNKLNFRTPKRTSITTTDLSKNPLAGTYKKISADSTTTNSSTPTKNQTGLPPPENTHLPESMSNKKIEVPDELLPVFLSERRKTINTLLTRYKTSIEPDEQKFLRTTIHSLDKQLVNAEKKLNALNQLKNSPHRTNTAIRTSNARTN